MAEPPWIVTARSLIGKVEDGPAVVDLAHKLAAIYPEYGPYLRLVHDDTPWCGEFVAYCLAANGIRPQFVDDSSDTNDFLWAQSWKKFGITVDDPQVGDILVFARHVTFYVGEDSSHYECLGGNQSDGVNITRFPKSSVEAIRRPPQPGAMPTQSWKSAKGSWYSQFQGKYSWVDTGDRPDSNALGVPDETQGIALYDRPTLGDWFDVTAPNGVTLRLRQTDIGPHPNTGRGIDIAAVAAERFGYTPRNFPTDEIFSWRPASESAPVPNQPPVIVPPTQRVDASIFADVFKQLGPIIAESVKAELQKPETQQAMKGFIATAVPKLLGALGVSVPGIGIIMMVAGWVLPLLLPDVMGNDGGQSLLVSGAGVTAIPIVSKFLGILDRFKAPQ